MAKWEQLDAQRWRGWRSEVYREQTQYFRNHQHRMDYPRYIANGWQIGSGPVESGCKRLVTQRLKGAGMRWKERGTNTMSTSAPCSSAIPANGTTTGPLANQPFTYKTEPCPAARASAPANHMSTCE